MPETLDAALVRRWCAAGVTALRRHESEINQLNVYPVPDADTGTNLTLTLSAARQALRADPAGHLGEALAMMALGALRGARGNSGVIVAQLLRGLADTLASAASARGRQLAEALTAAAKSGYTAVAEPVEGTILLVATATAAAARAADTDDLATVTRTAAAAAAAALRRTPEQLAVLASAGVVDAGGRGLVVLLDALLEVVTGDPPSEPGPRSSRAALAAPHETGSPAFAYEVQFLLDAPEPAVTQLRRVLGGLGDSLVVGGGDGTWKVHVHANDVGAALEAGVVAGRIHQIEVTRFEDRPADLGTRGVVVVADGAGLVELFTGEGAQVVRAHPSPAEMLAAIRATGSRQVVVLADDPDARTVAAATSGEVAKEGVRVWVVPTRSPVQALAALAVRDGRRDFADDVIAMAEAAGACRSAQVCLADGDALTVAGRCRAGDVLALVDGEVHLIGADVAEVSRALLDRLLGGGGELVSLLLGEPAPAGLGDDLAAHLKRTWPFVDVSVYVGRQPDTHVLVGIE